MTKYNYVNISKFVNLQYHYQTFLGVTKACTTCSVDALATNQGTQVLQTYYGTKCQCAWFGGQRTIVTMMALIVEVSQYTTEIPLIQGLKAILLIRVPVIAKSLDTLNKP